MSIYFEQVKGRASTALQELKALFQRLRKTSGKHIAWYDNYLIILGLLIVFWPVGVFCIVKTKRVATPDKLRLLLVAVALLVAGLLLALVLAFIVPLLLVALIGSVAFFAFRPLARRRGWQTRTLAVASFGGVFGLLIAFGFFAQGQMRAEANAKFAAEKPAVMERARAALEAKNSAALAKLVEDHELVSDPDFIPIREQAKHIIERAARAQTDQANRLAKLEDIGEDVWGNRFRLELLDSFGNNSDTLGKEARITIDESSTKASLLCDQFVRFFEEASKKDAVAGIDYFRFKCFAPVVSDDGHEENAQLVRFGLTASEVGAIKWQNMDSEMLLSRIRRGAVSEFWRNPTFNWSKAGW